MRATSREASICWMGQGTLTTRKKNKLNILTLTLPVHHHDAASPINMILSGPFHKTSCRKLLMSEALSQEIVLPDCFPHACVFAKCISGSFFLRIQIRSSALYQRNAAARVSHSILYYTTTIIKIVILLRRNNSAKWIKVNFHFSLVNFIDLIMRSDIWGNFR